MLEPYSSPISWFAWRYLHEENIDTSVQSLAEDDASGNATDKSPWEANIAIPTLLFWRDLDTFQRRFPNFSVVYRDRFDLLLYPLSGGFERRQLVPTSLAPFLRACERLLKPVAWLFAFRCFVVIEKATSPR